MRPIVVVGAGGHGREVLDTIEAINASRGEWEILGVVADPPPGEAYSGGCRHPFLGGVDVLRELECWVIIGIGSGVVRHSIDTQISSWGHECATLIHPDATVGSYVDLGPGTVICAGARVTTNVTLGRHVHVNMNSTVAHDCRLGDYVSIYPLAAVSGNVSIGAETTVGAGAVILEGRHLGPRCFVGAGAVVTRDFTDAEVLVGVPARPA